MFVLGKTIPVSLAFASNGDIILNDSSDFVRFSQNSMIGWPTDPFLSSVLSCLRINWRLLRLLCLQVKNKLKENDYKKRNCLELILWNLCKLNQSQDWRILMLTVLKHISKRETLEKNSLRNIISFIRNNYQLELLQPKIDNYLSKRNQNQQTTTTTSSSLGKRKRSDFNSLSSSDNNTQENSLNDE